jgi:hypothetical protein
VSFGLLRRVALVRTDGSEEPGASFIRVTKILGIRSVRRLLVAACVVPRSRIFVTLMKEAPGSSETSDLTRATRRNNPEDTILHSHRRENLKSYKSYIIWVPGSIIFAVCLVFQDPSTKTINRVFTVVRVALKEMRRPIFLVVTVNCLLYLVLVVPQ